ncbi:hypothetical protein GOBAR_AA03491 [Gossypium barbadense]|uniref:Uncharacterized protein n=1 Tax=Gossypium barbadense TaxID=3634 RepID=A0A2P5YNF8_GOSBA|nr:hypothetical protein GOBAR_AA03491 [Gossypium barbadense]
MHSGNQAQTEVQRLRDQMAQMQASTVEQIAQLKAKASSLKEEAAAREADSQQYMHSGNQAQTEVQRLRDQMAQMQASTVEQIAQLKAKASSLKEEAAAREAE